VVYLVLLRRVAPDGFAMLARPLLALRRRTATRAMVKA
jgi:hypothetical protein